MNIKITQFPVGFRLNACNMQLPCTVWFLPRVQKPPRISIGNSMICNDIWYKYHEWYFKLPCYAKFGITNVALWVIFWWFVVGFWIERWSRWSPEFFFQASLRNCINCVHCDDHFFIFISFPQFIYGLYHISLRWLDTVFQDQYLPSLSINCVAKNKVLEKLPPQLF